MDVLNVSATTEEISESFWRTTWIGVKIATLVVCLLGLLGNLWSYRTAELMSQSNSTVLMRYLAVWDSVTVICVGIIPTVLELFPISVIHSNVSSLSEILIQYFHT